MKTLFLALLMLSLPAMAQQELHLIPQPQRVSVKSERAFLITPKTPISCTPELKAQAQYLHDLVQRSTGYDLPIRVGDKKGICLSINTRKGKAEGYRLVANGKGVNIEGEDAAGAFYGIQTLLQLLPPQIYSNRLQPAVRWEVPAVEIEDAPNRPFRGLMFDVARYFYDIDYMKRCVDLMAHYKLNKLQFHLIDDSGWRLEIKKYPRLTEVGAWSGPKENRLGGYYTQEEMRELIAYAAVRGVEIIPEIEFPAHILSAVAAYPHLCCTGEQHEVPTQHFISRDLLCVGRESSMQFLKDVLEEVVALFPSPIINIGGDEAVYTRWESCPHCQTLMKKEGLEKAGDLQGWLTNQVATMMKKHNKTCMGWEEIIMRGKVSEPVVAVIWHEVKDTIMAKETGHKAILAPATHLYFDFPEEKISGEIQAATWLPPISLEKAYSMPINDYSSSSTVLGVMACYWSDQFIHGQKLQELPQLDENRSERYAEYLLFPRLMALSELGWLSESDRSWKRFSTSNDYNYRRLDALDVPYRLPQPHIVKHTDNADHSTTFTLEPTMTDGIVVYTTDGTYPTKHSPHYTKPVTAEDKDLFRAATLYGRRVSLPVILPPDYSAYAQLGEFVGKKRAHYKETVVLSETYDLSGRLRGNGKYTLSIIDSLGSPSTLTKVEVWKRNERIATLLTDGKFNPTFEVTNFEAGTPFTLNIERSVQPSLQEMLLFLKKQ